MSTWIINCRDENDNVRVYQTQAKDDDQALCNFYQDRERFLHMLHWQWEDTRLIDTKKPPRRAALNQINRSICMARNFRLRASSSAALKRRIMSKLIGLINQPNECT